MALGEELFRPSRVKFWALAPFLVGGIALLTFPFELGDAGRVGTVLGCDVVLVLLLLSLWPYHRLRFARRGLTGAMAALYLACVIGIAWGALRGELGPRSWRALVRIAALSFLGVPCLVYTLRGRFTWRVPPLAFAPDEPLMLAAFAEARASWPRFVELHPKAALAHVQFALVEPADPESDDEPGHDYVWGEVLEVQPAHARVLLLNAPILSSVDPGTVFDVLARDVYDWELEFADGSLEGGFTTRAKAAIAERDELELPDEARARLRRYRSPVPVA